MNRLCTILMSSSPEALRRALAGRRTATVEAEYGMDLVEGTIETLAHHGPRSGNPAPCERENRRIQVDAIGVSHIDLDTLGGIAALHGCKPEHQAFWNVAAKIDVLGPHRLEDVLDTVEESEEIKSSLHAWWAWSEANRSPRASGENVVDVTEYAETALSVIQDLIDPQPSFRETMEEEGVPSDAYDRRNALIKKGEAWAAEKAALDAASFIEATVDDDGCPVVIIRRADAFVNHLYRGGKAVASLNGTTGAVSISLAMPVQGVSCAEIAQSLWGQLAGGHATIAGSPRGEQYTLADARRAGKALAEAIAAARGRHLIADCAHCEGCGAAACPLIEG